MKSSHAIRRLCRWPRPCERPLGRVTPIAGLILALSIVLRCAPSAAQPRVIVRSETRIEIRTALRDGQLEIDGVLRDDQGAALTGRVVQIRTSSEIPGIRSRSVRRRTDANGHFNLTLDTLEANQRLTARFGGDPMHARAEVARTIDPTRAEIHIQAVPPEGGQVDLDRETHLIEATLGSEAGAGGIRVALLDELGRSLAETVSDPEGAVRFQVSSADLGPPGAGRLSLHAQGDAQRSEALLELPIIRSRGTHITLMTQVEEASPSEAVTLEATLSDAEGPLAGRAVGLFSGDDHLATRLTDSDGRLAAIVQVPEGAEESFDIVARYASDTPGRRSAASPTVSIAVRSWGALGWIAYLIPVGVCLIALFVMSRLSPATDSPGRASLMPRLPFEPGVRRTRRAQYFDVSGRVCTRRDEQPLSNSTVEIAKGGQQPTSVAVDDQGRFRSTPLPTGTFTLQVRADGYTTLQKTIAVPHRGQFSELTVRLDSLRDEALEHYRAVAVQVLPNPEMWPLWTNREVAEQAKGGLSLKESVQVLGDRVEPIYYGATPPSEADVADVRSTSRRAEAALLEREAASRPEERKGSI